MAYCRNCGIELNEQAKFCPNCGAAQHGTSTKNVQAKRSEYIPYSGYAVTSLLLTITTWILGFGSISYGIYLLCMFSSVLFTFIGFNDTKNGTKRGSGLVAFAFLLLLLHFIIIFVMARTMFSEMS